MSERILAGRIRHRQETMTVFLILLFFAGGIAGAWISAAGFPGSGYVFRGNGEASFWQILIPELAFLLCLAFGALNRIGLFLIPVLFFIRGAWIASVITGILAVGGIKGAFWTFLAECPRLLIFLLPVTSLGVKGYENVLNLIEGKNALSARNLYLLFDGMHLLKACGLCMLIASEAYHRYKLLPHLFS